MTKPKIAMIGVGGMGQAAHLRNYAAVPECEIVAIAELRPNLAERVAARYGIKRVYPNHQALLENEQVDAIVAIQPFGMHANLVPDLLQKAVPVMIEKPLADTLERGELILKARKAANVPLFLAYHKRSDPAVSYALQQIAAWKASNEVGKLKYIRVIMPAGDWVANGFAQNLSTTETYVAEQGMDTPYGAFVNYYIHQVNLLRLLLGENYRVTYADPQRVLLAGSSDSGVTIAMEMSPFVSTLDWQEQAFVCFEKGWIRIDLPAPLTINRAGSVTVYRDPGKGEVPTTTTPTMPWVHAMWQQARNFVSAIKGEKTVLCTAEEGLQDLIVARQYIALLEESQKH